MTFKGITIVLPGHGWDELASPGQSDQARGLLCAITAPWHPAILRAVEGIPHFQPLYDLHRDLSSQLIVVPPQAEAGLAAIALDGSSQLCRPSAQTPHEFAKAMLDILAASATGDADAETVLDFWALGYIHAQLRLLTYRAHYASGLNTGFFAQRVLQAADAWAAGDRPLCQGQLAEAHQMLKEDRWNFYPVDSYLLDVALLAESARTLPADFDFRREPPFSLIVTGRGLERLAEQHPDQLAALKEGVKARRICLLGGELTESPWFLLSCESVLSSLRLGRRRFLNVLDEVPSFFARRRFGLTPLIVQTLVSLGYRGVMQSPLDAGRPCVSQQPRARWTLPGNRSIDALGKFPIDGGDVAQQVRLGAAMAMSMEADHLATVTIAHWLGKSDDGLDLLRRSIHVQPTLGQFVTLAEYLAMECHRVAEERLDDTTAVSPYLQDAVESHRDDPISRWVDLTYAQLALEEARCLAAWSQILTVPATWPPEPLAQLEESTISADLDMRPIRAAAATVRQQAGKELAAAIVRPANSSGTSEAMTEVQGAMLINPQGFLRRLRLEPMLPLQRPNEAIAWSADGERTEGVIEVPSFGYVYMPLLSVEARFQRAQTPVTRTAGPLGEGLILSNEHLEAHVHPQLGGLRAVYDFRTRGNRASQRLTYRQGSPPRGGSVLRQEVTSAERIHDNGVSAAVRCQGNLTLNERALGRFQQTITVVRGLARLQFDIRLEIDDIPHGDPWSNYWASTMALPDPTAPLHRALNWQRSLSPHRGQHVESCWYLEWLQPPRTTALLTGGLPFHVRRDQLIDTLLCVGDESVREFQFALAIDPPNPLRACLDFLSPPLLVECRQPPRASSGWLLHVDARHVQITAVEPLLNEQGQGVGLLARLLETRGKGGTATLSAFLPIAHACQRDFADGPPVDCTTQDGAARVPIRPHEWTQVELHW